MINKAWRNNVQFVKNYEMRSCKVVEKRFRINNERYRHNLTVPAAPAAGSAYCFVLGTKTVTCWSFSFCLYGIGHCVFISQAGPFPLITFILGMIYNRRIFMSAILPHHHPARTLRKRFVSISS